MILCIGGIDSSGGAGLGADQRVISHMGGHMLSVCTAITTQTFKEVEHIYPQPHSQVRKQTSAMLRSFRVSAVKIGMLPNQSMAQGIFDVLQGIPKDVTVVLDPVQMSSSGHSLVQEDIREALEKEVRNRNVLLTPNVPEALFLLRKSASSDDTMISNLAEEVSHKYQTSVYLKGGHITTHDVEDCLALYENGKINLCKFTHQRIEIPEVRGTGCTLASLLAYYLSMNNDMVEGATLAHRMMCGLLHYTAHKWDKTTKVIPLFLPKHTD